MRSPRRAYIEKLKSGADESDRVFDLACRFRVYRRDASGEAQPAEWLKTIYGGRYDTWASKYTGPADAANVAEIQVHPGQLQAIQYLGTDQRHVVNIGPAGGGKTEGIVSIAVALSARRCNAIGGMVAPVAHQQQTLWKKYVKRVQPLGWIRSMSEKRQEIQLRNGTLLQFRATKKAAKDSSSPIAGLDWHWAIVDEESYIDDDGIREVKSRGRVNPKYQIFSSGTNESIHFWQMRLRKYHANPYAKIIRYTGPENAFTSLDFWEAIKADFDADDYERYVNCKDVAKEGRVFPRFSYSESTAPLPTSGDITREITLDKYQAPYDWIVGWDPGIVASASIILKAYRGVGPGERNWFAVDEVTTRDGTTEFHARDLTKWFHSRGIPLSSVLVIGDPHENKDTDRSDYIQMRAAGFTAKPSNGGQQIEIRHRVAMTNALLQDATGRRRLYLVPGSSGAPQANKLAESLGTLMWGQGGLIDYKHKTAANVAHWGEALGYGLFPFERMRGGYKAQEKVSSSAPSAWRAGRVGT